MRQMQRCQGALLGLAVGDAVGTTAEFAPRGNFTPLTDMTGGGPFGLEAGQWTDDTSMALCLATSLVECGGFDARDQMDRYCRWMDEGYLSANGKCFDVGGTVAASLRRYQKTGEPFSGPVEPMSAGNGCIMRLAPVPLFYYPDLEAAERFASDSARTTHGAPEATDACRLLAKMICRGLAGGSKQEVALPDRRFAGTPKIEAIAQGTWVEKERSDVRGSGYVVESLEAALWCFWQTDTFSDAVLAAANLGDDADTTAAVCGQIAGAYYGSSGIPEPWLERLTMREEITRLATRLCDR